MKRFTLVVFVLIISLPMEASLVGTFYGGWCRNKGDYIWVKEHGQDAQFITVGDVNGDGFEDAITSTLGNWETALSESYKNLAGREVRHFGGKSVWLRDFGFGADGLFTGDLNGDSRTDIAAYFNRTGRWEFAISLGERFQSSSIIIDGLGNVRSQALFSDVNGDGLSDAVICESGKWQVRLNTGNGFAPTVSYIKGFGTASSRLFIADVNGDGAGDAIALENGVVQVALSNGSMFSSPRQWLLGVSADEVMFADATIDGKADLILFHMKNADGTYTGTWEIATSDGKNGFSKPEFWYRDHGCANPRGRATKGLPEADLFFTGYVQAAKDSGCGVSPIAFNKEYGQWQVMPPKGMFPDIHSALWYNSWHTWNRGTLPRIGDEYYGFDAEEDTFAIRELIRELAGAEIDYVLFDQTNTWGALVESYRVFAAEISKWNKDSGNRKVKYAIAGNFKAGPSSVEKSAENTLRDFYNHPDYGGSENYQYLDGKPLLVCYGGPDHRKDRLWAEYDGKKSSANQFTVKWMNGTLRFEDVDPENPGDWYGWAMVHGILENSEQMVVQPGFYNGGLFSSRWVDGIEGDRYRTLAWDKVLLNQPRLVTIISFVGDMEQNDVYDMRVGDYPQSMNRTELWSYPDMYWEMTRDYIQTYRKLRSGDIQHMAEYGRAQVSGNRMVIPFTKAFPVVPVVYATLQGDAGTIPKRIQVADVRTDSFSIQLTGAEPLSGQINWIAVQPGSWETPNGMKVVAGRVAKDKSTPSLDKTKNFTTNPAVLSMPNTASRNTLGWMAFETGKRDMWSGRFCTAMQLETSRQPQVEFNLPRKFYDKVLCLVDSSSGNETQLGEVIVLSTTNQGGSILTPPEAEPDNGTLSILSFDGGGGCLYARKSDD